MLGAPVAGADPREAIVRRIEETAAKDREESGSAVLGAEKEPGSFVGRECLQGRTELSSIGAR